MAEITLDERMVADVKPSTSAFSVTTSPGEYNSGMTSLVRTPQGQSLLGQPVIRIPIGQLAEAGGGHTVVFQGELHPHLYLVTVEETTPVGAIFIDRCLLPRF
jgi:hypothetical protein